MRPLNAIFSAALTITGCQPTDCGEADCSGTPLDPRIDFEPGFEEAKRELESEGIRLPDDSDERVADQIDEGLRERCEVMAYMAARWHADGTSYDGVIISRRGPVVADIDGRFAPHREDQGVFAGGYTVSWDTTAEPRDPKPVRPDGDDRSTVDTDRDEERDEWKSTPSSGPTDAPSSIQGTMGGHYSGTQQTFAGTISRGTDLLPVRGMWGATDRNGGYALGAVLDCSDSSDSMEDGPIVVEVAPEPTREG
jgi:hypothetical protein